MFHNYAALGVVEDESANQLRRGCYPLLATVYRQEKGNVTVRNDFPAL